MGQRDEDFSGVAEALRRAFPGVGAVTPLRRIGEGFSSLVVETAGGLIYRIGKSRFSAEGFAKEVRLLPAIADYLPISIPDPEWFITSSEDFPHGVMGYRKLLGRSLSPDLIRKENEASIAKDVARLLVALHGFPVEKAHELGIPSAGTPRSIAESVRAEVMPALHSALTNDDYERVSAWWDSFVQDARMSQYTPKLRHCDLWYENLLVNDPATEVIGVLDFEAADVGDPALDFAAQMYLGESFARQVLSEYRTLGGSTNRSIWHRIEKLLVLHEFDDLLFELRANNTRELEGSIAKIRRTSIFAPRR